MYNSHRIVSLICDVERIHANSYKKCQSSNSAYESLVSVWLCPYFVELYLFRAARNAVNTTSSKLSL